MGAAGGCLATRVREAGFQSTLRCPTPRRALLTNRESPPRSTLSGGMTRTSRHTIRRARDRTERRQRWTAALATALLHLLLVLLVMPSPPISTTTPSGRAGGSAMEVTLLEAE